MDVPAIRYTRTTDGLNIAYQVVGEGPFDLVIVPQVISNVEIFWENPRWAGFMRELAAFSRLVLFDRRGVGLSDRPTGVPPLEQRMDDVRAVMDAVGSERAALFGTGPDGACAADGACRPVEAREKAVAGRVDLAAAKTSELTPHA